LLKLRAIIQPIESFSRALIAFKLSCLRRVRFLAKSAYYLFWPISSSVHSSVCLHVSQWLPLNGFSWNLILGLLWRSAGNVKNLV